MQSEAAGAARVHGGLAVPKSLAAEPHGDFNQALTTGPEGLKPFPERSLDTMCDIPTCLCYNSMTHNPHCKASRSASRLPVRPVAEFKPKIAEPVPVEGCHAVHRVRALIQSTF